MKAIRIHRHGSPEVLQIDEMDISKPAPGEVLVKVKAAALNHLDLWVRRGIPGVKLPIILGSDAAGTIEELGTKENGQSTVTVGDEVFIVPFRSDLPIGSAEELSDHYFILGEHINGVQAEYITVPIDFIMTKPDKLSWEETAAFPLAYMTAYHMLTKKVQIHSDQTILIWGASSGIGSAAIQIAKLYNARVITTAGSNTKTTFALQLGADAVINYNKEDVSRSVKELTDGKGVDIVFEHVGESSWNHSLRSLKKGGIIVTCGATTGATVTLDLRYLFIKHQQIIGSTMGNRKDLSEISTLINKGQIRPVISQIFDFGDIQEAHRLLENNQQQGKIILRF